VRPGPPANRTMQTMLTSGSCTSGMTPTASYTANNQLTSALYHYDQAGDVDVDPQNQYLYDAEGRICAVSSPNPLGGTIMTGYIYDADGTRVSKGTIQAWSCNPTTSGYTTTSDYILGPGGEQFSEYTMTNGTMTWLHTNVWADGMLIATYAQDDTVKSGTTTQNGLLHFYFDDPLGTRRAQTDYAGHLEQNCSSLPYGDSESCGSSPTEHLFTGKERDTESGNDYFGARYYASSMGRFMSPDWSAKVEPVPYSKLDDPQSLNLYAYLMNNPLGGVDADGHAPLSWGGFEDCSERNDCNGGGQTAAAVANNLAAQMLENRPTYMSKEGQEFVKGWETESDTVYDASGKAHSGDWTIGWGHKTTKDAAPIDSKEAEKWFQKDVARMSKAVARDLKVDVTQNQFDALVSLRFNAGPGNVTPPVTDLNLTGQATKADFTEHYITAGGVFTQGLLNRRTAEWNMFNEGVYDATH